MVNGRETPSTCWPCTSETAASSGGVTCNAGQASMVRRSPSDGLRFRRRQAVNSSIRRPEPPHPQRAKRRDALRIWRRRNVSTAYPTIADVDNEASPNSCGGRRRSSTARHRARGVLMLGDTRATGATPAACGTSGSTMLRTSGRAVRFRRSPPTTGRHSTTAGLQLRSMA